jgi:hypothetical protein
LEENPKVLLLSPVHVLYILYIVNNVYYTQIVKYGDGIVIYFSSRDRKYITSKLYLGDFRENYLPIKLENCTALHIHIVYKRNKQLI